MDGDIIDIRYDKRTDEYRIRRRGRDGRTNVLYANHLTEEERKFTESWAATLRVFDRWSFWCRRS